MATLKQKEAFKRITENHGNTSKTMLQVGYRYNTAKKPSNLTESIGWKELMDKHLSDRLLAKRHQELLNKREKVIIEHKVNGSDIYKVLNQPETQAVSKGLDMAYKLKGKYAPEQHLVVMDIPPEPDSKLIEIYARDTTSQTAALETINPGAKSASD